MGVSLTNHDQATVSIRRESTRDSAEGPLVSVIIPHFNDLDNLRICLHLLAEQTFPKERYEIVVADNNSDCGLEAVEAACAGIARVFPAPLQGPGAARDVGVNNSSAPIIAFIDSDCRPSKDWLSEGVKALSISDMVGGGVEVSVANPGNPTPTESFELVFAFDNKRYVETQNYSITGNLFVRRSVFEAVGGFRPYFAEEDLEWGQRAAALGYRWRYEPKALIVHPARQDWQSLLRKWRRITKHSVYQASNRQFGVAGLIFRTAVIAVSPLFHTMKVIRSRKLEGVGQKIAALKILYLLRFWRVIETYRELLR